MLHYSFGVLSICLAAPTMNHDSNTDEDGSDTDDHPTVILGMIGTKSSTSISLSLAVALQSVVIMMIRILHSLKPQPSNLLPSTVKNNPTNAKIMNPRT